MLDKYIATLFEEYKNATGYDYNFEVIEKDFYEWLKQRKKAYALLARLYMNMDNESKSYCMVEYGKGKYNTVLPEMKKICDGELIAVTPFKDSFKSPGFKVYKGNLSVLNNEVYTKYDDGKYMKRPNCSYIYNHKIDTVITELPVLDMNPYAKLFDTNKTVLIGKCGFKTDLDRDPDTDYLACLSRSLADIEERRVMKFDYIESGKYYAAALKVYTKR